MTKADAFPSSEQEWNQLVQERRVHVARFMRWASARESIQSMRLRNRADIVRVETLFPLFDFPWWAAVVYTCFDSVVGTRAVADVFRSPVDPDAAAHLLDEIDLPPGAVHGHRIQPAHKGARTALTSACEKAGDFEDILLKGNGFHDRYDALRRLKAKQWGRTTCFDLLVRAGGLGIGLEGRYEPDRAYLADSTGPRKGFQLIWGIEVLRTNAAQCEALLRGWTTRWTDVAQQVGVDWLGEPYGPGDFENSLCIFQEPGNPGYTSGT